MNATSTLEKVEGGDALIIGCLLAGFVISLIGQMTFYNQNSTAMFNERKSIKVEENDKCLREIGGKTVVVDKEAKKVEEKRKNAAKKYTLEEIEKHNKMDDLWLVIDGSVYNVSKFVANHPGGHRPLLHMAGRDASDVMAEYHPANVYDHLLPSFYIGDVADYKIPELIKDYREIRQSLLARGLFETSTMYYVAKITWLISIFLPSFYGAVFCKSTTAHMISAIGFGLFWQQLAFLGHDLGHNAVSHHLKKDHYWGALFGNFFGGIALGWWKANHNTHHVTCNSVEHDPDIQHLPFMAIDKKLFGKFWSSYYEKYFVTDAFARFMVSYQHYLYVPIMMLARFNLYVRSYEHILLRPSEKLSFRKTELISLLGFAGWLSAVVYNLPSGERIPFLLLSHAFAGLLHVQITISHFSMQSFNGISKDNWIVHQMTTTENVSCPTYMDWFHGGLQYQLEHHLFPRLPRHNLRIARQQVLLLAKKHNLTYIENDFIGCVSRLFVTMKAAAYEARKTQKGDAGFYESPIYTGLQAEG